MVLRGDERGYIDLDSHQFVRDNTATIAHLRTRVAELEAKSVRHAEEIDEWKEASGIVTGSGDPADVTPTMAASYWNDIDRDLTKSQVLVEELQVNLRMSKIGDEVGHKLLDVSIDDGAEKVGELISLRARVAELEARLSRRNERIRDLQKCQDRLRELDKIAQSGEGK